MGCNLLAFCRREQIFTLQSCTLAESTQTIAYSLQTIPERSNFASAM
jgi:hypothetical protein